MKKIAVYFPGIGYTVDKPLMHYARRIAAASGYEIRLLPYTGFPAKIRGDRARMEESYRIALAQSREMLSDVNLAEYDRILFVGKSVGTIVAAQLASESTVRERIRMVLYTPLEAVFAFSPAQAVVFTGSADPWVGGRESRIPELCRQAGVPCHIIPEANHSLETGSVQEDIRHMLSIMAQTQQFVELP